MKIYKNKVYLETQLCTKGYREIAKENGVSRTTIQRYLNKYGLTKKAKFWISEEIKLLLGNYSENPEVYELFPDRTVSSMNHKANKLGLKRLVQNNHLYNVNQDFFKRWSSEMAYILGFFFSDGNVSSNKSNCGFHLHLKDRYILGAINKGMESDYPVKLYENSCALRFHNKVLCKDLISLGCIPRKSLKLKFPGIPNKYLSHFIRGVFDGDGSIHFTNINSIKVSFISTKNFIEGLQVTLHEVLGLRCGPLGKHKKCWSCIYYGGDARKLCSWMYENCKDLYLKRKRERYSNHLIKRQNEGV